MTPRGTRMVGLLLVCAALGGCSRPCFVTEADYDHYQRELHLPTGLEQPAADVVASIPDPPEPASASRGAGPSRYLSLVEAIALALEHGTVGVQSNRLNGVANDDLVAFFGRGLSGSDSIRVLALEPALAGASIEA